MVVLWVTLLLFHQAYPLIPMKTVQVGEPVTFTCVYPDVKTVQWFRQSAGETLKQIVTAKKTSEPAFHPKDQKRIKYVYGPGFSASRFNVTISESMSSLRILRTTQEDEGTYHWAASDWTVTTWSSTYLSLKGSFERTSNLSVIQSPSVSDPVRPGDSMTLQCSVLSDSDSKTCPGGHRVFWFRAGSDKSYPDILYTDQNRSDGCDQSSNSQKSCVYHFSKSVSSSDAGTYYCAVAACGRILFGDGAKVDVGQTTHPEWIVLGILIVCLVISVVGNVLLLCKQKALEQHKGLQRAEAQADNARLQTDADDELNYAALEFSVNKTRGRKKREFTGGEDVYAHVRC